MQWRRPLSGNADCTRAIRRGKAHLWAAAAAASLALAASAGCASRTVDQGSLTLIVKAADNTNPLADPNAATLYLEIDDSDQTTILEAQSFDVHAPIEIDHVPMGPSRYFKVQTREVGGGTLRAGSAGPIDLNAGEHVVVTVILQ